MPALARIIGVVLMLAWAPSALAQSGTETAIRDAITRQLDAMKRGDWAVAFTIASPAIQAMFGDAANFMSMVERGYPQIYRSRSHRFLKLDEDNGKLIQRVLIEIDGAWRINGCSVEKPEGA